MLSSKGTKKNFAVADKYSVEVNLVNGKCVTPMINDIMIKNDDHPLSIETRSDPIVITNATSPLLRNGFSSSSAPSHLNGFANGFHNQNGHHYQHIDEDDIDQSEQSMLENGNLNSLKSIRSEHKVILSRTIPLSSQIKKTSLSITSGKSTTNSASNNNSSQPQQSATPILLVASR